ncbi:MAG: transcriptional regulator BetI [Paracoccus denitrificans]|nr:MAG: transcriptional regulator BetI [Paracoccus denitrificans]PZO84195.1 MAG: transcriptional regulator BetI [Paracoccus denitrificans]
MPRVGVEPIRKAALINAAIEAVGRAGSLEVTVAQIARAAGVSSALAHHYFGTKNQIFLAAMRFILTEYRRAVMAALADTPADAKGRARVDAIINASFDDGSFGRDTVAAWLNFYTLALTDPHAARLLAVYRRRLKSNLTHALRDVCAADASRVAATLGALIDGVYLRASLDPQPPDRAAAVALVMAYLDEVTP